MLRRGRQAPHAGIFTATNCGKPSYVIKDIFIYTWRCSWEKFHKLICHEHSWTVCDDRLSVLFMNSSWTQNVSFVVDRTFMNCAWTTRWTLMDRSWTFMDSSLTLSLPRVINFPCSLTRNIASHSMKNLAFYSLVRWKMITLPILTPSPIHLSIGRLGECSFWTWEWKG